MAKAGPSRDRFVEEYLIDLNGTQAAIRAGYSAKSARAQGSRLLADANVQARIAEAKAERSKRVQIDADYVLKRLVAELEADVSDILTDADGTLKQPHEWPEIWRKGLVSGFEVQVDKDQDGNVCGHTAKVKLSPRIKSLELLGRHTNVQAFKDNVGLNIQEVIRRDWRGNDPS